MLAQSVVTAAKAYVEANSHIGSEPRFTNYEVNEKAEAFHDIFRRTVPVFAGVYWFYRPDGLIFDIGKSEGHVWGRICEQTQTAVWGGPTDDAMRSKTSPGWGFPNSRHLMYNRDKTTPETINVIENGTFRVGWVALQPYYTASLLEVYLQTLCMVRDGKLPELCYRIG